MMPLEGCRSEAAFFTTELVKGNISLEFAQENVDKVTSLRDEYKRALKRNEEKNRELPPILDNFYMMGLSSFINMAAS